MSDFVFSRSNKKIGVLSERLKKIYSDNTRAYLEFHSEFGSLSLVENHYKGYAFLETDDCFCLIIGGPVLKFRDNDFLSQEKSNEGTKAIYHRWREKKIEWDKDVSGPFVFFCLDKKTGAIQLVTDMMSFIPVYISLSEDNLLLGTHADVMASICNSGLDEVSITDMIFHEVVTFPYTIYEKVRQLNSASSFEWNQENESNKKCYWIPEEPSNVNLKDLDQRLHNGFTSFVNQVSNSNAKIASFISGGEDSRLVLSAVGIEREKDSFIFVDGANKESKFDQKVARKLHSNFIMRTRLSNHYWNIFEPASDLIGTSGDFAHVHTYDFHKSCNLDQYDAIFGGFLADTLLKGHHLPLKKPSKLFRFLPIPDKVDSKALKLMSTTDVVRPEVVNRLRERREKYLDEIKKIRPNSANEWFRIWPITMHNDTANIYGNRRLFRSFEPFTDCEVVKVAASAPQWYKLNRMLFLKAFQQLYKTTRFVRHGSGYFPYYPWYVNNIMLTLTKVNRAIQRRVFGKHQNDGSWSNWNELMKMDEAKMYSDRFREVLESKLQNIFVEDFNFDVLENQKITVRQRRILLQLGYQFSRSDG